MSDTMDLGFCKLTFEPHYMIAVINEGVNVGNDENEVLIQYAKDYYGKNPFVYITHRKNSYSVDPNIYPKTARVESLSGFAVVSDDYKTQTNAEIEKMFFSKPFEIFTSLDKAISWALSLINE